MTNGAMKQPNILIFALIASVANLTRRGGREALDLSDTFTNSTKRSTKLNFTFLLCLRRDKLCAVIPFRRCFVSVLVRSFE